MPPPSALRTMVLSARTDGTPTYPPGPRASVPNRTVQRRHTFDGAPPDSVHPRMETANVLPKEVPRPRVA